MNKVMLIGNVGADPEVRYVEEGVAVARLRLATTERGYTLQNGTQVPDRTDWHQVILWRRRRRLLRNTFIKVTSSTLRVACVIPPMMINRDNAGMSPRYGRIIWRC